MHRRCKDTDNLKFLSYRDCVVCEEWQDYQNFAEWAIVQQGYGNSGWQLDKDILFSDNSVYCPDRCVFVPRQINSALTHIKSNHNNLYTGVRLIDGYYMAQIRKGTNRVCKTFKNVEDAIDFYKTEKEMYIKDLAEQWRSDIDTRVYLSLLKFKA